MCACRFEAGSSPSTPSSHLAGELMRNGITKDTLPSDSEDDDVYAQLSQKERDLTLAAELGKALLEQNQELTVQNEQLVEGYTQKLEELEQEKYELHLRFEKMQAEYESIIKELQYDIVQLRHDFQEQEQNSQAGQREKTQAVEDIVQQNEVLCEEMRLSSIREDQLMVDVQNLQHQVNSRRTSMHEHVGQLESLQEELNIMTARKLELDRHIAKTTEERNAIACSLEESQGRIAELEKQNYEQEQQIHVQGRELEDLLETSNQLQAQLEFVSERHNQSSCSNQSHSLYSELSQMDPHAGQSDQSQSLFCEMSAVSECAMATDSANQQAPVYIGDSSHNDMSLTDMIEDEIECDDSGFITGACAAPSMLTDSQFLSEFEKYSSQDDENQEFQQDILCIYKQLQQLCQELGKSSNIFSSVDDIHRISGPQSQNMKSLLRETRALMQDMITAKQMQEDEQVSASTDSSEVDILQEQIRELQTELWRSYDSCDKAKSDLRQRESSLKKKMFQLTELTTKLKLQQQELGHLQSERDRLQDCAIGQLTKDQVLEETRKDRNEAIKNRNELEVKLAMAKEEVTNLNSQLLEAVQQKVALSTQLDQWQEDMEELLGIQLTKRIQQESDKELAVEKLKQQLLKKSKSTSFLSLKRH